MNSRALSRSSAAISPTSAPPTKGTLAGAGQDHQPQLRIRREPVGGFDDLGHQRAIEAVQLRRIVDRQSRETAAFGPFLMPSYHVHCMTLPLPE
jgi:hypothetical protein